VADLAPTLLRSTLIVADLERSLEFYLKLGFQIERDVGGPREPKGKPFPLNVAARAFRLCILRSAVPDGGRLGLLEFGEPDPEVTRTPSDAVGIGDVAFVVQVTDATRACEVLAGSGARIVSQPLDMQMRGADGSAEHVRLFHVFDPDGHVVEVFAKA
jgi:catechol 2,3-dioxygenase-like lactoylglutathione lyase family enzyme